MKHESYRSPMASYDIKEYFERRLEPAPLIPSLGLILQTSATLL